MATRTALLALLGLSVVDARSPRFGPRQVGLGDKWAKTEVDAPGLYAAPSKVDGNGHAHKRKPTGTPLKRNYGQRQSKRSAEPEFVEGEEFGVGVDDLLKRVASTTAAKSSGGNFVGRGSGPDDDYASWVNPFIGTGDWGDVYPCSTRPFGMAKPGLDTDAPDAQAGYDQGHEWKVLGISQMHDSGTGGAFSLGNFKLLPLDSCKGGFENCNVWIKTRGLYRKAADPATTKFNLPTQDDASPGYFYTIFENDVSVELTSTRRVALHRYVFPNNVTEPRILVDSTMDGQQIALGSNATVLIAGEDDGVPEDVVARVMTGGHWVPSFAPGSYYAYACVDFKAEDGDTDVTEYGIYNYGRITKGTKGFVQGFNHLEDPIESGSLFTFKPRGGKHNTTILARVGISWISAEQACANGESEIADWDFKKVRDDSRAEWNKILSKVEVDNTGVADNYTTLLYSGLYRTHIQPQDYTGENPLWKSKEPYFDSLYCNWDTYRLTFPLFSLIDPLNFARIVRSLIDTWRHEGFLPECRMSLNQGYTQGSSHGDEIVAELLIKYPEYVKDLGINFKDAWNALMTDANHEATYWTTAGRQVTPYLQYKYIPVDVQDLTGIGRTTRQASRTIEYAYGDFNIAQVAASVGDKTNAAKYHERGTWWENLWDADFEGSGFKGMLQMRYPNGTWKRTEATACSVFDTTGQACSLEGTNRVGFYESSPVVYSQYTPSDMARLIELNGGNTAFIKRLNKIFNNNSTGTALPEFVPENAYYDPSNEPSFNIPIQYIYANKPGFSSAIIRQLFEVSFTDSPFGLPGNDDSGAMAAYTTVFLLGLYPIVGTRQLLLTSPYFSTILIHNELTKHTTTIKSHNFKPPSANSTGNVYIGSVDVKGNPYKSNCYVEWKDLFLSGDMTLDLYMQAKDDVTCGTGAHALPPSYSTGGFKTFY